MFKSLRRLARQTAVGLTIAVGAPFLALLWAVAK